MPKPKRTPQTVAWLEAPQPHDFPAAASYLALIAPDEPVSALIEALHTALTTRHSTCAMAQGLVRPAAARLMPSGMLTYTSSR